MSPEKDTPDDFLGLKAKRETLRLTLQDISALTRISLINLEAIENGAFCHLPAPIYSKNFIKSYARALNLDSKPLLDSYEAYLTSLQAIQTPLPEMEPPRAFDQENCSVQSIYSGGLHYNCRYCCCPYYFSTTGTCAFGCRTTAVNYPRGAPARRKHAGKSFGTGGAGQNYYEACGGNDQSAPPQQKSTAAVIIPPGQGLPLVEKKATGVISAGTDLLVIKATEEAWLRIRIDQNPPFQVLLKPGEEIKRTGSVFELDIGNAGGITMQFKGKTVENLGKPGEVIHLQLP